VIKKKFGNSVERNYEKRLAREYFRINKTKIIGHYDIIFYIKNNRGSFSDKEKNFQDLLKKIQEYENK